METGLQESRDGSLSTQLEESKGLCIPPFFPHRAGSGEGEQRTGRSSNCDPSLAVSALVPSVIINVGKESYLGAKDSKPSKKSKGGMLSFSSKQNSPTSGLDSVRKNLLAEGISKDSAELILHSRNKGKLSHYESSWRQFCSWCDRHKVNPFRYPLTLILQFLTEELQEGKEYNTIAGYRSTISAFHYPLDGCRVGVQPTVSALMKGIFNKKPPKPKYTFIWNVDQVLGYLETLMLDNKNLGKLTYKLVMLLALTSAFRASEIWQLDINYMVKMDTFYRFTLAKPT